MAVLELLGWLGTFAYLVNHAYVSIAKDWRKWLYYGGNLFAALCLVVVSIAASSWQAVIINGFWAAISLALLAGIELKRLPVSNRIFMMGLLPIWCYLLWEGVLSASLNLNILGWSSAFVFSCSYLLFSAEKMAHRHYLLWNAYAALALMPQLWLDQNWPVFVLESVWALISVYGAMRRYQDIHLLD